MLFRGATTLIAVLLSAFTPCGAESAQPRPIIFDHYVNYQSRKQFELINALVRVKLQTRYIEPFLGASYEDYNAEINSYAMAAGLLGFDVPLFDKKIKLRYEYKIPNSSTYEQSSKYGLYTGLYKKINPELTFDSYAEFFQVDAANSRYNAATAWIQVLKDSFLGTEHLKPHVEIYYKDSLFENTMQPLKELRVGLWYQNNFQNLIIKVRGFAYSDVYNKQGVSGELVMGGVF